MPRKRIRAKRRLDRFAGAEAWSDVFEFGFAFFDDFSLETGVQTDGNGRVPPETAEIAWHVYGPTFIAERGRETSEGKPLWALEQFGEPHAG
jgi:hypothetical protein